MIGEISNTQHSKDNKFRIIQFDSNNKNVQPLYSYSSIINLNRKQSNMTKPNINSRNMMNNIKIKKNHSTIITEINRNSIIKSIDDNVYVSILYFIINHNHYHLCTILKYRKGS